MTNSLPARTVENTSYTHQMRLRQLTVSVSDLYGARRGRRRKEGGGVRGDRGVRRK